MSVPLLVGVILAAFLALLALILIATLGHRQRERRAPAAVPQSSALPSTVPSDGPPTQPREWALQGRAAPSRYVAPPPQYNGPPRYTTPTHGTPVPFRAIGAGELALLRGQANPEVHDLSLPAVRIGRSAQGNHVVVQDPMVSGAHAEIRAQGGGHYIQDLRSTNGTYVNGERIVKPYPLSDGDRIALGNSEWVYQHRGRTVIMER